MFNWSSVPTFVAMLLFWLLAAYVLTRSPRGAVSLTAIAAQVSTACYLFGQGMGANALAQADFVHWMRSGQWGAVVAPTCWYWLTLLLLRQQEHDGYTRRVATPLGLFFLLGSAILAGGVYAGDALLAWSQAAPSTGGRPHAFAFTLPHGPLYPALVVLVALATIGAISNVVRGWGHAREADQRRRFAWLLVCATLFLIGANLLGVVNLATDDVVPGWVGHLVLAAAMLVMAWNVAAYSLLFKGLVIRTDFFYFVTALVVVCGLYGLIFLIAGLPVTLTTLGLLAGVLILTILSHAFVDLGRRALDRLFFKEDVQSLRSNLAEVAQQAAMAPDLEIVLDEVRADMAELARQPLIRAVEQALRRLNNPAALGQCDLVGRLPQALASWAPATQSPSTRALSNGTSQPELTPLEQAQALRDLLISTIDQLKPLDGDVSIGSPGALQYHILREEYLQGLLNKQIMARHNISEGTFHRNRRQAIATLAQELQLRERSLPTTTARAL